MLDIVARIERLPAPGETLFARSLDMFAGGKGANQAIAARRLGAANVTLIGRVGADVFGERVLATLRESGVDTAHVASGSTEGTGVAIPMVFDDGGNSIISVPRANMRMTVDDVTAARDTIAAAGGLDAVLERAAALRSGGNLRLACHLVEFAVLAEPGSREAHALRSEVYDARAKLEPSSIARNILNHAALASAQGKRDLAGS